MTVRPPLRLRLPAGMLDAGLASAATFLVGVYAAGVLDADVLGVYALFFSTFLIAILLPRQLYLLPSEVRVLRTDVGARLTLLRETVPTGLAIAALSPVVVVFPMLLGGREIPASEVGGLGATMALAAAFSPIQDHVRTVLHLSHRSWLAAATSAFQLAGVGGAIGVLDAMDVAAHLVPFGALALANVLSLSVGLVLAARQRAGPRVRNAGVRELMASGRWLLAAQLGPYAVLFAVNALVIELAGADVMGFAEAARVVAQPIVVLTTGIAFVLGPESMSAARLGDAGRARRMSRVFNVINVCGALALLALVGGAWPWNPMLVLVPRAYEVAGLVAVAIVANMLNSVPTPARSELIGGGSEASLAKYETGASLVRLAPAAAAPVVRSFAPALGTMAVAFIRIWALRRAADSFYGKRRA